MLLHGKGQAIRDDFTQILGDKSKDKISIDQFKRNHGTELFDLMFDNFMIPLLEAENNDIRKTIVNRLDLFCAAFYSPIK